MSYIEKINVLLKELDDDDLASLLMLVEDTVADRKEYARLLAEGKLLTDEQLKQQVIAEYEKKNTKGSSPLSGSYSR